MTTFEQRQAAKLIATYISPEDLQKSLGDSDIKKSGEGSRGGKIIGHTKSGKPVYSGKHETHYDFTKEEHKDAYELKLDRANKHGYKHAPGGGNWGSNHTKEIKHNKRWEKLHDDALFHHNPSLEAIGVDSSSYKK